MLIIGLIIAVLVILFGLIIAAIMLGGAWAVTQAFPETERPTPGIPPADPPV